MSLKPIDSLNNKYTSGCYEITMTTNKFANKLLINPLTHLLNSSLITGVFPDQFQIRKIKPLFKSSGPKMLLITALCPFYHLS